MKALQHRGTPRSYLRFLDPLDLVGILINLTHNSGPPLALPARLDARADGEALRRRRRRLDAQRVVVVVVVDIMGSRRPVPEYS